MEDDDEFDEFDIPVENEILLKALEVAEAEGGQSSTRDSFPNRSSNANENRGRLQTSSSITNSFHPVDPSQINTWIYPINYPVRDYQFNIIQRALHTNTLVSLPTGLGKTFIAAVLMYNYYRWFPESKIVFMAPTRPLVAQQIEACYRVCGIPQSETAELTGAQNPESRKSIWREKRVFFLTPQVMQNDIMSGTCPSERIVCMVVDEAHRAMGSHSYCEVIRKLHEVHTNIRVLALTATPGSDVQTVQSVITNLRISRIEIRTEESLDIRQYIHRRTIEPIVIPLNTTITSLRDRFSQIMNIFLRRLNNAQAFHETDPNRVTRYLVLMARNRYRETLARRNTQAQNAAVEGDFTIVMSLSHALNLLQLHGIYSFYLNLQGWIDEAQKTLSKGGKISRARQELMRNPDFNAGMDSIRKMMDDPTFSSHPKLERLVSIVVHHFANHEEDQRQQSSHEPHETRAMIFSQYRESVSEIARALEAHKPMIRVMTFIGQASARGGKGFSQKDQLKVISQFQKGGYNVLVCTSIGEEGLDIGDVDLIICYDSQNSPIRMLQRMGRTGRKRQGRVHVLLTEGKEEQNYKRSLQSYKTIQKAIASGERFEYYPHNPRILPEGVRPVCDKRVLEFTEYVQRTRGRRKTLLPVGEKAIEERPTRSAFSESVLEEFARAGGGRPLNFMQWQKELTPTSLIGHSKRTRLVIDWCAQSALLMKGSRGNRIGAFEADMRRWLNPADVYGYKEAIDPEANEYEIAPPVRNANKRKIDELSAEIETNAKHKAKLDERALALVDDEDDLIIEAGLDDLLLQVGNSINRQPQEHHELIDLDSESYAPGEKEGSPEEFSALELESAGKAMARDRYSSVREGFSSPPPLPPPISPSFSPEVIHIDNGSLSENKLSNLDVFEAGPVIHSTPNVIGDGGKSKKFAFDDDVFAEGRFHRVVLPFEREDEVMPLPEELCFWKRVDTNVL
ncbi:uncharacterized protein VTP21DRAFT_1855 [Calcarisporiella thermophila]|uniref:uncharacterized protein n=1 Tax=Calcarisporiella thermophila TaxID=911321 RepID=UPI00374388ED